MTKQELIIDKYIEWLHQQRSDYNNMFNDKESVTEEELNERSSNFINKFYQDREKMRTLIKQDMTLLKIMYEKCKNSFLIWILHEGVSKDVNRNPRASIQAVIPYNMQLKLIEVLQYGKKNIHVEKSRRMGISLIMVLYMTWNLIFKQSWNMFTTHKSLSDLDKKGDTTNTTFGKIRLLLQYSMFIPQTLFNANRKENVLTQGELTFKIEDCRILVGTNSLEAQVLSPSASVGQQMNEAFLDEVDVSSDQYPNANEFLLGGISSSTNRLVLYSTYRSMNYPFYKIKEQHDDRYWDFITVDWKDHLLCNKAWYDRICSIMRYDKVLISRELDHNPSTSIEGLIFYYISDKNEVSRTSMKDFVSRGKKILMMDPGGGSSATAILYGYLLNNVIYIDGAIKSTSIDEHMIKREIDKIGFTGVPIVSDIAGKSQSQSIGRDWFSLLRNVGIQCIPVNNQGVIEWRQIVNYKFLQGEILYNKDCIQLRDFKSYRYLKDGQIDKGTASHVSDALMYGVKYYFPKSSTFGFI